MFGEFPEEPIYRQQILVLDEEKWSKFLDNPDGYEFNIMENKYIYVMPYNLEIPRPYRNHFDKYGLLDPGNWLIANIHEPCQYYSVKNLSFLGEFANSKWHYFIDLCRELGAKNVKIVDIMHDKTKFDFDLILRGGAKISEISTSAQYNKFFETLISFKSNHFFVGNKPDHEKAAFYYNALGGPNDPCIRNLFESSSSNNMCKSIEIQLDFFSELFNIINMGFDVNIFRYVSGSISAALKREVGKKVILNLFVEF